jgi:hypothetical protein
MKKFILCVSLLMGFNIALNAQQSSRTLHHAVSDVDISNQGIASQKITLTGNSTPLVKLSNIQTTPVVSLPLGAKASNSFEQDVIRKSERKKQVAFINVPVFRKVNGQLEQLLSYDLEITEFQDGNNNHTAQKPTGVENSVLASGTWFKIAAPTRGVYKITYQFLESLGINPAAVNPNNFRVYGNGGTVLPEEASSEQPDDLIENAIYVSSTGNTFGANDYILFYANGPVLWGNDTTNHLFDHTSNYYENQSYYFLNYDIGQGKRIQTETATGNADYLVNAIDDYMLIENDSVNLNRIGKMWWGNRMSSLSSAYSSQNFTLNLGNVINQVKVKSAVASDCIEYANMTVKANGTTVTTYTIPPNSSTIPIGNVSDPYTFTAPAGSFGLSYTYSTSGSGNGYIDYIQLNYRKSLQYQNAQFNFRDWQAFLQPAGQNAAYNITGANANLKVWDVSSPLKPIALNGSFSNGTYTVIRPTHTLSELVAFDGSDFRTPVKIGSVPNQDLHGLPQTNFLIIAPDSFMDAANELAEFHRQKDNLNVTVVQVDKIYNEFSSGGQDIGGIRNFIKMFYDRSQDDGSDIPENVLFFGAASFDYKNRVAPFSNFVPTYETYESMTADNPYSSDDFYAILADGSSIDNNGSNDVATGRIPAHNRTEAAQAVAKIKNYVSSNSFGPWKNTVTYVADDRDANRGMNHMGDCETVSEFFIDSTPVYNVYKIYSDAYQIVATPSGGRYPMVNKAIDDQTYNGTFLMSYSGHGSPDRWATEAILTSDDYSNWTNINKLPVMVTATCDFGRFDDQVHPSAGTKLMLQPTGGSIAMITTTQAVYQSQNTALSQKYVSAQFAKDGNGKWRTIGEALRTAKNAFTSGFSNNHKYVVLGDPALKMAMPVHNVETVKLESINGSVFTSTDTIKALGRYLLSGKVTDANNNIITDFNGPVYITIFDKVKRIHTVNEEQTGLGSTPEFDLQTNIVAKMKGTVTDGLFSASFVAPKDINYNYGNGKISYYANTESTDASGIDNHFTVGDYNHDAVDDNTPPVVKPYIDNDKFRDGGVTDPNPLLYVKLFDENGINVSGTSIGHDLVAILDDDVQNPFVMNNYYETVQNDFSNGYVNFPMYNLPEGKHTVKIIAWDTYNNSGEGTVTFEVKNKDKGFISDIYNYPNPASNHTTFVFQHNQKGEEMDISILIYTANGRLMKTIKQHILPDANRTEIPWDCTADGLPLGRGVYFYKLNAKISEGKTATAYQKLVLLR